MRRRGAIGLLALALLGLDGNAFAGLPCAAYSSSVMAFTRASGTGLPCGECDLLWCPSGDYEKLLIRVTVRDCLSAPVPACDVRLDLSGRFDPNNDLLATNQGRICGGASRVLTTNAAGAVEFPIYGGGAGRHAIHWVVTALCATPEIELAARDDTLCIKSFNFNGSGSINFADTFQYIQQLNAGHGYSSDWRYCSDANVVNFGESFVYSPHLTGGHTCVGGAGQSFLLTKVVDGLLPDCDELF